MQWYVHRWNLHSPAIFLIQQYGSVCIHFSEKKRYTVKLCLTAVQGHSRSLKLVPVESVNASNTSHISHSFEILWRKRLKKIWVFSAPPCTMSFKALARGVSLSVEFAVTIRALRYPTFICLDLIPACDRHRDRQADRRTHRRATHTYALCDAAAHDTSG